MPKFKEMMDKVKKSSFDPVGMVLKQAGRIFDAKGAELIWDPKTKKFHVDKK